MMHSYFLLIIDILTILFTTVFRRNSTKARILVRWLQNPKSGNLALAKIVSRALEKSNMYISPSAIIGSRLRLPHPTGIVIGSGVEIGCDVTIYQSVTLGGRRSGDHARAKYPKIGDNSIIYSGAAVLGDITIGKNCVIGANAVVLCDLPDNAIAVGVPARIILR
jgi:serine O-acetyltransferase